MGFLAVGFLSRIPHLLSGLRARASDDRQVNKTQHFWSFQTSLVNMHVTTVPRPLEPVNRREVVGGQILVRYAKVLAAEEARGGGEGRGVRSF